MLTFLPVSSVAAVIDIMIEIDSQGLDALTVVNLIINIINVDLTTSCAVVIVNLLVIKVNFVIFIRLNITNQAKKTTPTATNI